MRQLAGTLRFIQSAVPLKSRVTGEAGAPSAKDWWVAGVGGRQPETPGLPSLRSVQPRPPEPLTYIAHGVGRIKPAANAGTAQTKISGHHTLSPGSTMNWRAPLRQSLGLLGPAYDSARNTG